MRFPNPQPLIAGLATILLALPALAADVEFEGSLQSRGRFFNGLSLTNEETAGLPEGNTFYVEHRLWLRPKFFVSDRVRLTLDIKGFDNVAWGDRPELREPWNDETLFSEGLTAPTSDTDATVPLLDLTLWRAWADIDTDVGRLSFGRMPLHWGVGMWQNDGMSLNAEHGDTVDRVQFEALIQDSVFVRAALDTHAENFINEADDTYAASLSAAYKSEKIVGGLQAHYRHTDQLEADGLDLFTIDGAMEVELGKLDVSAEGLARFGGGDLPGGVNDVNITGFGAVLDAKLTIAPWQIQVEGGFASGDKTLDSRIKTFTFDRDYNVGIILFEQPMPIFKTAAPNAVNGNRDFDKVLLGDAVSNALFLKPTIRRTLVEGLDVHLSALFARTAALPDAFADRKVYGSEYQVGLNWNRYEHFELDVRGALFQPGSYFRNFSDDTIDSFDRSVVGVQATGRVAF